jgi:hypothetical protein
LIRCARRWASSLSPGSHPRFETIAAVCRALGVKVEFARGRETAKAAPRTLIIDDFRAKKQAKPVRLFAKAKPAVLSKEDRKQLAKRKLIAERKREAAKRPAAKRRA